MVGFRRQILLLFDEVRYRLGRLLGILKLAPANVLSLVIVPERYQRTLDRRLIAAAE